MRNIYICSLVFFLTACSSEKKVENENSNELTLKKGVLEKRVSFTGEFKAPQSVFLYAPYDGFVKKIFVKQGQAVKKGQALFVVTQSLDVDIKSYPVRAPFSGVIVEQFVQEGQQVRSSSKENYIVRLEDIHNLEIQSMVAEVDYINLKLGLKAEVKATALPELTMEAEISQMALSSHKEDPGSRSKSRWGSSGSQYSMRVSVFDASPKILPGMSAAVDVIVFRKKGVLLIPHEYVSYEDGLFYASLESEKKEIKLGSRNELYFEVLSGLKEGDKIRIAPEM